MELMDEWESNTNRRICWGSAGRYRVAGQLQEGWSGLPLGIFFFREGDAFPLERGLQRFLREGRSFCLVILGRERGQRGCQLFES